jgi:3' exoribonuclease, RNase T-like
MIDLECLDQVATAAIVTIGVIAFEPDGPPLRPLDELSEASEKWAAKINLQSCLSAGLTIDPATLAWWLRQEEAARLECASAIETGVDLKGALLSLSKWLRTMTVGSIWAHGASFEVPILEYASRQVGVRLPFHYKIVRDTRTLYSLADIRYTSEDAGDKAPAHTALADAYRQAVAAQRAWKKLKSATPE